VPRAWHWNLRVACSVSSPSSLARHVPFGSELCRLRRPTPSAPAHTTSADAMRVGSPDTKLDLTARAQTTSESARESLPTAWIPQEHRGTTPRLPSRLCCQCCLRGGARAIESFHDSGHSKLLGSHSNLDSGWRVAQRWPAAQAECQSRGLHTHTTPRQSRRGGVSRPGPEGIKMAHGQPLAR
jgi:hypothetical protein